MYFCGNKGYTFLERIELAGAMGFDVILYALLSNLQLDDLSHSISGKQSTHQCNMV